MSTSPMLTARQQEIWQFLVEYVDNHGYPPTVREIGDAVGLASMQIDSKYESLGNNGYRLTPITLEQLGFKKLTVRVAPCARRTCTKDVRAGRRSSM